MIDISALLLPISDTAPCGEDLSFSPEFDVVQELRRSDDSSLDQGEWVTELKTADWPGVIENCSELLRTRTKDLRLAAWMVEALARDKGFRGLADGYALVAGLCEKFWGEMFPVAEDNDQELRVGNLSWLLSQSIRWMRAIPLTRAPEGSFTMVDLETAARHGGAEVESGDDHVDMARIDAASSSTPFDFYQGLAQGMGSARAALDGLQQVVDGHLGVDGPSFSSTRDMLQSIFDGVSRMTRAAGVVFDERASSPPPGEVATAEGEDVAGQPVATAPAVASSGSISTRREALMQLQKVAEFFRGTEPHSPVAYLADRAVRWGNMPLHVWLKTVLKDEAALGQLQELLGVGASADIPDEEAR